MVGLVTNRLSEQVIPLLNGVNPLSGYQPFRILATSTRSEPKVAQLVV